MWRLSWGKLVSDRELAEGATLPRGYGVAWYLPHSMRAYCLPVPLNRIAGACRAWYLDWRRPCKDDPIMVAYQLGESKGFQRAYDAGYNAALRFAKTLIREELTK